MYKRLKHPSKRVLCTVSCNCTLLPWKKQNLLHILRVYLLRYLSRMHSACALLFCHLWPVRLFSTFPHYLTNGTIFRRKVIEHKMCVLIFSTTFVRNLAHYKKNSTRYCQKCTKFFMSRARYVRQILLKVELSQNIIEEFSNTKSHENSASGSRADGRTDRHDEANSRFSQFRRCAQ